MQWLEDTTPGDEVGEAPAMACIPLDLLASGTPAVVRALRGGQAFVSRIAAMGIVIGSRLEVLQNPNRGPLLVRVRDTRIALGRGEARKVLVEEVSG